MVNTKQPFIYTQEHKMRGALPSSSSSNTIPNNGVHQVTAPSTYNLAGPRVGSLVTIYCASTVAQSAAKILSVSTVTGSTGQVSFNSAGGTAQALFLVTNSTLTNSDVCVTLIGENSTQWRVMSAWPGRSASSTLEGVLITT
jgi:hypothetical protein